MKKKILAVVMGVLLVLSAGLFTACGSDFDGKYTECTKEQVELYANSVVENEIDYSVTGVKLSVNMEIRSGENYSKLTTELKSRYKDESLQAALTMTVTGKTEDEDSYAEKNAYYTDGYLYTNGKEVENGVEEQDKKLKFAMPVFSFEAIDLVANLGLSNGMPTDLTILEAIREYEDVVGVKFYMDETDKDMTKIKISIPKPEDNSSEGYGDIYFLFNGAKNLIGVKVDIRAEWTTSGKTNSVYSGASVELHDRKVKLPKDLDTYEQLI